MRDEELERRVKANAEAFTLATGGEQTKLIAESLNRQVDRVRELVAAAAQVETAA